jgi:hypothetical protein
MQKTHYTQHEVNEILENLNPQQAQTVENLRQLIRDIIPTIEETVRQGRITFRIQDRDLVWLTITKSHVDVEFAMGSSLSSPLLKTRGATEINPNMRHIKVNNFTEVKAELKRLIKRAAAVSLEQYPKT